MFRQQIIGFINISWPIIVLFYVFPGLLDNTLAHIVIYVFTGINIWYLNYAQHKRTENGLLYFPSAKYKEIFDTYIRSCNVDPAKIIIKYAYTAQQIAMAFSNTVVIDPTTCSLVHNDPNIEPVKDVFHQFYESNLNDLGKNRQTWQLQKLTPEIQMFIFKHELGHIVDWYSYKKLGIIFLIGTLSIYSAIGIAQIVSPLFGVVPAIMMALIVGVFVDLFLTYFSNLCFKVAAEKRADAFAVKYSTTEEIMAAADFFEQERDVIEKYKDPNNWLLKLSPMIYSGHLDGQSRKKYLLQLLENKK